MSISRRSFVEISTLASASLLLPKFVKGIGASVKQKQNNKILVFIQMTGGNDGLNTVVPYRNDIYYKSRPLLAIKKEDVLTMDDEVGMNSNLKGLKQIYDEGSLCLLNDVGYPMPDRSHFRSMDIWQTASGADEIKSNGWIGKYIETQPDTKNKHNCLALELGDSLNLAMVGKQKTGFALSDTNMFDISGSTFFRQISQHDTEHLKNIPNYLYQTLRESISATDYLIAQNKIFKTKKSYPDTLMGKRMKTVGELILSGTETRVFYVPQVGYDTHVNQANAHQKLLKELDEALSVFVSDLKENDRFNDVLIMTFSEFGRRVEQNASNGTDHGAANNMFLISGALKKSGLYNPCANLADLDEGDLKYKIDFKQVYATILDNWLQTDPTQILTKSYEKLSFI